MSNSALKFLFLGISLVMTCLAIITSMQSDMWHLTPIVLREPWFTTTLTDFYNNITIISAWVIYKEANALRSILWVIAFICLGSIATGFYVFLQLRSLKDQDGIEAVLLRRKA